ncbi:MAG: DUF1330 domain-containing protein, partial [Chitinophagaceae bacterium]
MAAYCYFDVLEIKDENAMQLYREKVASTVQQFNGNYIVIGGPFEVKEGNAKPTFPVMITFPTLDDANSWYQSNEYQS